MRRTRTSSNHDPSFFEYNIWCLQDGTQWLGTKNRSIFHAESEAQNQPSGCEIPTASLEESLPEDLSEAERDVLLRVACERASFANIGRDVGENRGVIQRRYVRALVKCRIHASTNRVHELFSSRKGCTVHPITLQHTDFSGFAISRQQHCKNFYHLPTRDEIATYLWKHRKRYNFEGKRTTKPPLYIGGCQGPSWLLEQTYIVQDYAKACAWAIIEDQKTIYDFQSDQNISVPYPSLPRV